MLSFSGVSGGVLDDDTDFGIPGELNKSNNEDTECSLSTDNDLLNLLNFKLKKFDPNPKDRSEIGENPLTPDEVNQNSIRFYAEQLKEVEPIRIQIETFTSMGGDTLGALISRSSKILLKHPEQCKFFSLYGDQIIGKYQMSFEKILSLYASAVNNLSLIHISEPTRPY